MNELRCYTFEQVAEILAIHPKTVYKKMRREWVPQGIVGVVCIGRARRVTESDLKNLIEKLQVKVPKLRNHSR